MSIAFSLGLWRRKKAKRIKTPWPCRLESCKVSELKMNEYSYLQSINGREDFFPKSCQTKRDTHTLILFNSAVWKQRVRTEHPSLIKPYYTDHTALHASVSTRIVHRTSTMGQSLFCVHTRNTKMSPFLCFSLPPTVSACPISLTAELVALIAPGAIAWGLQSLIIMGFPRGLKDHPLPLLPPCPRHPTPRRQSQARRPLKNNFPKMTTFSICSLIFFFL